MNLFNLSNILDKKISTLRIEPNLCAQTISPKSNCRGCMDVCPTDSITIKDRKIEIDEHCLECGLCSTVCPTNAILIQRPSVSQILEEVARKCKNEEQVYIHCEKQRADAPHSSTVKVPCLGALPMEAWITLLDKYENLSVFHSSCNGCEIATGFDIWQKELHAAEEMTGKNIGLTSIIQKKSKQAHYDTSRRELFSLFASELKSTNKLVVKEVLGEKKIASYQEKMQEDSIAKVQKEWNHVTESIVEKITKESVLPFMSKRKLLLEMVGKDIKLQERSDIRLPSISPECNFCGACSLLCPTDALVMESVNEQKTITLKPYKCVDCKLCEEICYSEFIKLHPATNENLFHETINLMIER